MTEVGHCNAAALWDRAWKSARIGKRTGQGMKKAPFSTGPISMGMLCRCVPQYSVRFDAAKPIGEGSGLTGPVE